MASSDYSCSIPQGFNFQKDKQERVGHIVSLKIGDAAMASDINVTDPEDNSAKIKVFGVMSGISWNGGYGDEIQFQCNVSTDNKNTLSTMVHTTLSNTEVEYEFVVYDYDPQKKMYYKCFHSGDAKLKGLISKNGSELNMAMDAEPGYEVQSPMNYAFMLGVAPKDEEMAIHMAVSVDGKFAKQYGIAQG